MTDPRMTPTNDAPVTVEQNANAERLEIVAKAIYDATHANLSNCYAWDDEWEPHQEAGRGRYYKEAAAAIAALQALASAPALSLDSVATAKARLSIAAVRARNSGQEKVSVIADDVAVLLAAHSDFDRAASAPAGDGVEALRALSDAATPGPWSWEQCGEKEDVPVVGIAFAGDDPDCKAPYEGEFRDSDAARMTIAYDWQSCDGHSPSSNAAFAVAAVNYVRAALARPRAAVGEQSREAIARIIDPGAWEGRDRFINAQMRDWQYNAEAIVRESLTRADAILALQSPPAKVE